jgi:hypothetical protein
VGADWGLSPLPVSSKPSSLEPSPSRGCMSRNLERIPLYAVRTSFPRSFTCVIERQNLLEEIFKQTFHFRVVTMIKQWHTPTRKSVTVVYTVISWLFLNY